MAATPLKLLPIDVGLYIAKRCNSTGVINDKSFERRWRSFKVTDFCTNRKSTDDFLLVNNTNLHRILHALFQGIGTICHIFAFDKALINALVWGQPREYRHEQTSIGLLSETKVLELHVCRKQYGSSFSQFDIVGSETYIRRKNPEERS